MASRFMITRAPQLPIKPTLCVACHVHQFATYNNPTTLLKRTSCLSNSGRAFRGQQRNQSGRVKRSLQETRLGIDATARSAWLSQCYRGGLTVVSPQVAEKVIADFKSIMGEPPSKKCAAEIADSQYHWYFRVDWTS